RWRKRKKKTTPPRAATAERRSETVRARTKILTGRSRTTPTRKCARLVGAVREPPVESSMALVLLRSTPRYVPIWLYRHRVFRIAFPTRWVIVDVGNDLFQRSVGSDDVFVEIPLPDDGAGRAANFVDPFSRYGFERRYQAAQWFPGRGNARSVHIDATDRDDSVNMIRHHDPCVRIR